MAKYFFILFVIVVTIFVGCKNNEEIPSIIYVPINCDGLVTDTAGTNDNGRVFMPTAFTSNNDGKNDNIKPSFKNITSMVFTLYDVQNNVVFTSSQIGQGWVAPAIQTNSYSVYYYKIQATTNSNKKIGVCGTTYNLTCFPITILPRSTFYFEDQLTVNGFTAATTETIGNCP
ncbi:MAG: hypothetical protein ABL929_06705 [Ferruginibacter sp.]|nr:hypothetical protein [Ferruginibacter sp.]